MQELDVKAAVGAGIADASRDVKGKLGPVEASIDQDGIRTCTKRSWYRRTRSRMLRTCRTELP